jgi:hypothetical protein
MYAKFHHSSRLQGLKCVLVFHGMTDITRFQANERSFGCLHYVRTALKNRSCIFKISICDTYQKEYD